MLLLRLNRMFLPAIYRPESMDFVEEPLIAITLGIACIRAGRDQLTFRDLPPQNLARMTFLVTLPVGETGSRSFVISKLRGHL